MELFNNKFSLAHPDTTRGPVFDESSDNIFIESISNASEQHRNEIYDIYFGGMFYHRDFSYGDVMGATPTSGQYKNLLEIQEKFGIPISVTFNEMRRPIEIMKPKNIQAFCDRIQDYYDDGVRSCTISHTHLMRCGALQERFPEMSWKNTVNHRIRSTQEMVDYAKLGYNVIQLDRDFNRNLAELKKSRVEADRLGIKTCLLVTEQCMPECPFKVEHDMWQSGPELRSHDASYWDVFKDTCVHWRDFGYNRNGHFGSIQNPRFGTDLTLMTKSTWEQFAMNCDTFKFSGRLMDITRNVPERCYTIEIIDEDTPIVPGTTDSDYVAAGKRRILKIPDLKTAWDNNLEPIGLWPQIAMAADFPYTEIIEDMDEIREYLKEHFWNSDVGKDLEKTLRTCRNQCYQCHKCDRAFGIGDIDSIIEV